MMSMFTVEQASAYDVTGCVMCVTVDGMLWQCDQKQTRGPDPLPPIHIPSSRFGNSVAVMVSIGERHMLLLTAAGTVWSQGTGEHEVLGHVNERDNSALKQVFFNTGDEQQDPDAPTLIAMVSVSTVHSAGLTCDGYLWTWGCGDSGQLGFGEMEDKLVPTPLSKEYRPTHGEDIRDPIVMMTTGRQNTLVVTKKGLLWGWGNDIPLCNTHGKQWTPLLLGTAETFDGARVLSAACGDHGTVILTVNGDLWSLGDANDRMCLKYKVEVQRVPIRIEHPCKFVSVSAFQDAHSAVTTEGEIYEWGELPPPVTFEYLPMARWKDEKTLFVKVHRLSAIKTLYDARPGRF